MKVIYSIALIVCILGCSPSSKPTEKAQTEEETVKIPFYNIIAKNESHDFVDKVSYDIEIYERLDEANLDLIADNLWNHAKRQVKQIYVSYYLPGMKVGYGNYALSERTDSGINRTTINMPDDRQKQENTFPDNWKIIGTWHDNYGSSYTIYRKENTYYMYNNFTDGSNSTQQLERKKRNGKTTYNVINDHSEFYVIENGNLNCYDQDFNLGLVLKP